MLAKGEGSYKQLSIRNVPRCKIRVSTQGTEVNLGGGWNNRSNGF